MQTCTKPLYAQLTFNLMIIYLALIFWIFKIKLNSRHWTTLLSLEGFEDISRLKKGWNMSSISLGLDKNQSFTEKEPNPKRFGILSEIVCVFFIKITQSHEEFVSTFSVSHWRVL